jgi:cysteinyl-tRNA synthetase
MLKIYNSLGRTKQEFVPLRPGEVRMYVCGMTVYDYLHLGHARMLVVFDVVQRWLRASGYRVTYVRNITDIDDKIIRRALDNGESIGELTARFIRCIDEDAAALGVQRPDHEPRATQYVPQMVDMIGRLEEKKLAYRSASGDVNFAVRRFPGYGKLSGKSLDELRAGERVEVDASKEDPLDFVLWKRSKPDEPKWPSRYGEGRPGWHIECSAMGCTLLGAHFDIHGGGEDLQFPHHENEIAQSEGANGVKFVNYWMHNGFLRVDEEKMSKSIGNFFTVREVLQRFDPEAVRFFILRAHYRSPLNYSDVHLEDAKQSLTRLYTALKNTDAASPVDWNEPHARRFKEAMDDDIGTPEAVAVLFELAHEVGRGRKALAPQLRALGGVLGLLQRDAEGFLRGGEAGDWVAARIAAREAARKRKDFAAADDIRRELLEKGIVLEDSPGGTTWRRA